MERYSFKSISWNDGKLIVEIADKRCDNPLKMEMSASDFMKKWGIGDISENKTATITTIITETDLHTILRETKGIIKDNWHGSPSSFFNEYEEDQICHEYNIRLEVEKGNKFIRE